MPETWHHALQEQIDWLGRLVDANLRKHPLGAAELSCIKKNLGVIMTRFGKAYAAALKRIAELEAQVAKLPPPDRIADDDDSELADAACAKLGLDGNGDPITTNTPPTEESLTADLKKSGDALTGAVNNAQ